MRKVLLSLSCIATLYAEQMYLYEISPIVGLIENGTATGMESSYGYGLQLQYNDIDFFIKPELTYIYSPNISLHMSDETVNSHLFLANGVYDLEYTALLTPFFKAGMGYQSVSDHALVDSDSFLMSSGAGLKLNIKDKLSIKFETMVTWHNFSHSNLLVFGGLDFSFGNEDNTPVSEHVIIEPLDINTTEEPDVKITPEPVYISKEEYNLTITEPSKQAVAVRNENNQIESLTLFVPYLFRGYLLDEDSKTVLKGYAKELRTQDSNVTVIGHTDAKGRRAFNQELSVKRAREVKELFVDQGVPEERITIEGRGESEPIADSKNPAANKLNKRIEIKVQSK